MAQPQPFQFGNVVDLETNFQTYLELVYNLSAAFLHIIADRRLSASLKDHLTVHQGTLTPEWIFKSFILYNAIENNVYMAFRKLEFSFLVSHVTPEDYQRLINLVRIAAARIRYEDEGVFHGRVFSLTEQLNLLEMFHRGSFPSDENYQTIVNELNASRLNEQVITEQQVRAFYILLRERQNNLAVLLGLPAIHVNGMQARQIGLPSQNLNVNGIGRPLLEALNADSFCLPPLAPLDQQIVQQHNQLLDAQQNGIAVIGGYHLAQVGVNGILAYQLVAQPPAYGVVAGPQPLAQNRFDEIAAVEAYERQLDNAFETIRIQGERIRMLENELQQNQQNQQNQNQEDFLPSSSEEESDNDENDDNDN